MNISTQLEQNFVLHIRLYFFALWKKTKIVLYLLASLYLSATYFDITLRTLKLSGCGSITQSYKRTQRLGCSCIVVAIDRTYFS